MASKRIRKKWEKRKLMETYEANRAEFKSLVEMASKYKLEKINAKEVLGLELPSAAPANPTIEWLNSNPLATSNHAYFQEKIKEYQKALRQERLRRTYFGDYDTREKGDIIKQLIDMKLIKNRYWAYEDILVEVSKKWTETELLAKIDEYVEKADRIHQLIKDPSYKEPGSFVVFDDDDAF